MAALVGSYLLLYVLLWGSGMPRHSFGFAPLLLAPLAVAFKQAEVEPRTGWQAWLASCNLVFVVIVLAA